MDRIKTFKAFFSAGVAMLTALWGWFGWLVWAWVVCMGLDYLTGTAAALKVGEWSSRRAREGLWHKAGCAVAVLMAGILDLVLGRLAAGAALGVEYTVFLCPVTVVWYILTEAGSVLKNAGALGAPLPGWLKKAVAALKDKVDTAGEK